MPTPRCVCTFENIFYLREIVSFKIIYFSNTLLVEIELDYWKMQSGITKNPFGDQFIGHYVLVINAF